jgi:sulfite exporter TauE/SafE
MTSTETLVLAGTAATIGLVHTILGPDHYLPFIVLARARRWNSAKTTVITALCGLGHVLSSVLLGFTGAALGIALFKLKAIEAIRSRWAAWFLIAFGLVYFVWGLRRAFRNRPHEHSHAHEEGGVHAHAHRHTGEHVHVHESGSVDLTPWVLFTIFVFGPCEPLIPLVMYPVAQGHVGTAVIVATVFGLATIMTMLAIVLASSFGLARLPLRRLEQYSHAAAGLAILMCGGAIRFLGL